jgi:hypothetical protein
MKTRMIKTNTCPQCYFHINNLQGWNQPHTISTCLGITSIITHIVPITIQTWWNYRSNTYLSSNKSFVKTRKFKEDWLIGSSYYLTNEVGHYGYRFCTLKLSFNLRTICYGF